MSVPFTPPTTIYSNRKWRVQDLELMPRGYRYEILDGLLYMAAMPFFPHPLIVESFQRTLGVWIWQHDLGHLFSPRTGIYYSDTQYVDPDLLFVRYDQTPKRRGRLKQATLAIEVVSESNLRAPRHEREALFHRLNIQEIWYADPESETVEVCERTEIGYSVDHVFRMGETLISALFPGFTLPVAHLWGSRVTSG